MRPSTNKPLPAPVRLAPIIRAPEREEKNARTRLKRQGAAPQQSGPLFTVYVNSALCSHSADLLREIREVRQIPCTVVDVAADGVGIPTWLRGTPSIVVGTNVYCGDTAFEYVQSACVQHEEKDEETSAQPPSFQDIVSGRSSKQMKEGVGCGLAKAFSPPVEISEEEAAKKYSGSVDDAVARLMQSRGS